MGCYAINTCIYHILVIMKHVKPRLLYVKTVKIVSYYLWVPSNKLGIVKCAYLLLYFFQSSVSSTNPITENVITVMILIQLLT
jgi:hypothetical protein